MDIPSALRYSTYHLWVSPQEDGTLLAGITDHAQETLGDIVYVEPPAANSHIIADQPCGIVESVKTASDLHAPLSGTVLEINPAVLDAPERINEAPYASWIFKIRPDNAQDADALLDAEAYRRMLDS